MRFRHPDGTLVHLAYCTNVHSAEDLDGVLAQLTRYAVPVGRRLGVARLGLGLWLSHAAVTELTADPGAVARTRRELDARGLEVVTLNAFPYQGFHAGAVKKSVYRPDWSEQARLDHTLDCARLLTALLPADAARGSVSTLPLGWREAWSADRADRAARHLDRLAQGLEMIAADTGRTVRVGFEPEPGCLIENTEQAVRLLAAVDPRWLGVCLDCCHTAVGFEDGATACARLAAGGLPVVKAQLSCALTVDDPRDPAARAALWEFAEPRFLHQTRESLNGRLLAVDDLPDALGGALPGVGPWRIHFHTPLHADPKPPLRSTRSGLPAMLDALVGGPSPRTDHLEVETYTWSVLPSATGPGPGVGPGDDDLIDGIAGELAWARDTLTRLGLKDESAR
ncbi:metabolite traffic protein EboE [Streptomyces sp. NPDC048717]|uniref:metabolite traffic protein EboE n=1 Tax=Streptomyces sp. NPDC048717 TaxID=3154928 RepID=UPI0034427B2D